MIGSYKYDESAQKTLFMIGDHDMKILHIHSDYPDGSKGLSTPAVKSLLEGTTGFKHTVFVIHRTPFPWQVKVVQHDPRLYSIHYWGFPFGLTLSLSLFFARKLLLKLINSQSMTFELIHGHKLAIDGTLAAALSNIISVPYFLSVRGGTDMRYLRNKKFFRCHWKKVLEEAEHIFWVSSWAKKPIKQLLKTVGKQSSLLPNPCEMTQLKNKECTLETANFVTVFRFEQYKRKGIIPLLEAIAKLRAKYPDIHLDIYGSGPKKTIKIVQDKISALSLDEQVCIKGRIENTRLQQTLKTYSAFLLPSKNESFGMVFVEALFSGLPILYHANTGIDGYLEGIDTGVRVKNQKTSELADKVEELIIKHDAYHFRIKQALEDNEFYFFEKETVVKNYQSLITQLK
jgi:glycosyltransferase involved in cell wall biosynthesis